MNYFNEQQMESLQLSESVAIAISEHATSESDAMSIYHEGTDCDLITIRAFALSPESECLYWGSVTLSNSK